ncbi:MAG: hypothetical protein ACW987_19370 [Candidatus Thorarchaeota archaeon]|jgi:hypothetical protein
MRPKGYKAFDTAHVYDLELQLSIAKRDFKEQKYQTKCMHESYMYHRDESDKWRKRAVKAAWLLVIFAIADGYILLVLL